MDEYEGKQRDTLSLHKYVYCRSNPVDYLDPDGKKTVIVVTDQMEPGARDAKAAANAAEHLRKGGWTIVKIEAGDFPNISYQFEGVIFAGHGDKDQAAAITVDHLELVLTITHSRLDLGIALTCHGLDFISTVSQHGYTTSTALVMGYWGYATSSVGRDLRVGRAIDKWLADPKFTTVSFGNLAVDGGATSYFAAKNLAERISRFIPADVPFAF